MKKSAPAPISLWTAPGGSITPLPKSVILWRRLRPIRKAHMREIILDTETTGLDPRQGHRIVEIGAVELINHIPSGRTFHVYIDPERDVPRDAREVHGLTTEFLRGKPRFDDIADDFLTFIPDASLVIHNADFVTAF